jgi:hypothetical protein
VLLTPAATLRSPIATAPLVAAMTLLVWRMSNAAGIGGSVNRAYGDAPSR